MAGDQKEKTRVRWLETIEKFKRDSEKPGSEDYWSPSLETAGRDELIAIQNEKLAALTPFLYENSEFYRRRFERLGLTPDDLRERERDLRDQLFRLRIQRSMGQLEIPGKVKAARRDLARVLTVLSEKQG